MQRSISAALLCLAGLLFAGCAATATGIKQSAMTTTPVPITFQSELPAGSSLVVVRFPAMVEPTARDAYHNAFLRSPIGGELKQGAANSPDVTNIADSVVLKSNYFALSLYKELVKRLPDHSVLLSPHAISIDETGLLTSVPMTGAESVASVLTVDFATYSFPDAGRMMNSEPLTFGDLITPLVVVQTDYRAAAPTKGLLMASAPLLSRASGNANAEIAKYLSSIQAGNFEPDPQELHFISFLTGKAVDRLAVQPMQLSANTNAVQSYPLEKVVLDRFALSRLNLEEAEAIDPLESVFSSGLADRIVLLLNDVDMEKAAMMRRAAAVANFDPNLAALSLVGLADSDYKSRMKYAERMLDAERKYLSIQSLRIFDGIHNGEIGVQVRDMLVEERRVLDRRRKLAEQQNMATAAAIAGVIATGVVISEAGGNANVGDYVLANALKDAAILATAQAISLNRQSTAISENFMASVVPALEEQTSVQVNLLESNETITAIRFEDLREKLQTLYTEKQRSIDTIATTCGFRHTGSELLGKWQGVCENGRAAGPGVGVVQLDDGKAYEYFGDTKNGQPHGVGFMIEHTGSGSRSWEGNFVAGLPDGIVKFAEAGLPDRLRLYKQGRDSGAAPPGSRFSSLFSNPSASID